MDERLLRKKVRQLPLGGVRYFERLGSTNDVALAWAAEGAPDLALVVAGEQTAGRGRGGHHWFTPPVAALAFSLILRPGEKERQSIPLFSALGALAVVSALERVGLRLEIKWPNDVLLDRRKFCGVLAESVWMGEEVDSVVIGIGVNVGREAIPMPAQLDFPATSLESELHRSLDHLTLLHDILVALIEWRPHLGTDRFLRAWEAHLAFRGEVVGVGAKDMPEKIGQVLGLERDGSLSLRSPEGEAFSVHFGEVHLRPVV